MTIPFFSIVIPTFNRSDLFPHAVRSVLKQTFEDFEIIVSDNCSADDTPQVAKQFDDPRFRYIRTPQHFTIADNWEFARSHALGKLIFMLSDDDALLPAALERFADECRHHDADFLFCKPAYYRDLSYPGADRNSVDCPAFSGASRVVQAEEVIRPLFLFRKAFDMHPSAFAFAKPIADWVVTRTGRFFWTNGVEYSAWPMAATFARKIVHIDAPLVIVGRTAKSWGSNIRLCNPGKERIQEFIKDVDHERKHAPLSNFTMCNLIAEGLLTAKSLFPKEFESYEFDELQYLRRTWTELRQRKALGVDVSAEMDDLRHYAAKYPVLAQEFDAQQLDRISDGGKRLVRQLRATIGDLGARTLRRRLKASQLARRLERGVVHSAFHAAGEDFGFSNVLGCAEFLSRYILSTDNKAESNIRFRADATHTDASGRSANFGPQR
jgi:glycosyltransferase involved in cell wall biosynthesis